MCFASPLLLIRPTFFQIRKTYRNYKDLQTQLFLPLYSLGATFAALGQFEEAINSLEECISCLSEHLRYMHGTRLMLLVAKCCKAMGNDRKAKKFANGALELDRIRFGGDARLTRMIYSDLRELLE